MSEIATQHQANGLVATGKPFDLSPQTFEQALTFAQYLADSDLVPKDFKGKPGNCLIAMQWGAEIGLKALQAIQNIAPINGRPTLWGDAALALVRSSPLCEYVIEEDDGHTATCRLKRRGENEQRRTFSMDDAKTAGLSGKAGPWTQFPKRMRQMRARSFGLRDVFPDVLRGMELAEVQMDPPPTITHDMGPVDEVRPTTAVAFPVYAASDFEKNFPAWATAISAGRKTADQVIDMVQTKAKLSDEQKARIRKAVPTVTDASTGEVISAKSIEAQLDQAPDMDALNLAADLIRQITDDETAQHLRDVYESNVTRLTKE